MSHSTNYKLDWGAETSLQSHVGPCPSGNRRKSSSSLSCCSNSNNSQQEGSISSDNSSISGLRSSCSLLFLSCKSNITNSSSSTSSSRCSSSNVAYTHCSQEGGGHAGNAGGRYELILPALLTKHKLQHPQLDDLPDGLEEAGGEARRWAILNSTAKSLGAGIRCCRRSYPHHCPRYRRHLATQLLSRTNAAFFPVTKYVTWLIENATSVWGS